MAREHWTATTERVSGGNPNILGEDERGDLWVPSLTRSGWWDRRFNPKNPLHWRYWLRSRLTNRIAFLELTSPTRDAMTTTEPRSKP
jgi:hypothetical protein